MPRRVLAMLLTNYNQTVSIASLIDELWETTPPRLARKTVQTYIYQLRKEFDASGRTLIESHGIGYAIRLAEDELDLAEFDGKVRLARTLLETRRGDDALGLFREALDLWRGSAMADIEPGAALAARIEHLEARRACVREEAFDVALALGRYREVVEELELLVRDHPLHEGFHAQLMTALAGTGNRSRALNVFEQLRDRLVAEIGLDPSDRVTELHARLLDDTVELFSDSSASVLALTSGAVVPAELPAAGTTLIGRDGELAAIRRCSGGAKGMPGIVVLTGQPGAGKTALAVRAGHQLRAEFPDGQLFAVLGAGGDAFTVLGSFLQAIGVPPGQVPDGLSGRERLYRSATADRKMLLVLDDVTDETQVMPLLPAGSECAVVITSRTRLLGLDGASVVTVDAMTEDEGLRLLASLVGEDRVARERDSAARLVALCEWTPLAIRAAAEKLTARPPWRIEKLVARMEDPAQRLQELVTGGNDPAVRFEDAVERLTPPYRWAFGRLCTIGPEPFTVEAAALVLDIDPAGAECPLAELVAAHLLRIFGVAGDGATLFQFPELLRLHVLSRQEAQPQPTDVPANVRQWTKARIRCRGVTDPLRTGRRRLRWSGR
jgi:DNA-binding SARP family transcriptional activator